MRRSLAVVRHELRILKRDPTPVVLFILMPLVLMAFLRRSFQGSLVGEGYPGANGSEQAVPGMTVMFGFFLVGFVGFAFFREHGWGTWERLRAGRARPFEIMVGKVVPALIIWAIQFTAVFVVGGLLFDLHVPGSTPALVLVAFSLAICLTSLSVALVAITRTVQQMNSIANLGALVFSGLGGALAPVQLLPGWARAVAPGTPSYWAMRGFRSVILDGAGVSSVLLPIGVLMLFAAGFTLLAIYRFRFEETKVSWA